jgi:putative ABC transport system substrate-binding protein
MASHIERRKFLATLSGAGGRVASRGACAAGNAGDRVFELRVAGIRCSPAVEGRNLVIQYRWAGNQADRLPALAADLVQLRVAAIVSPELVGTLAAKAATTSIPIVFNVGVDPVQLRLVASLNQPGGNLTGFNNVAGELGAKGLALLHEHSRRRRWWIFFRGRTRGALARRDKKWRRSND